MSNTNNQNDDDAETVDRSSGGGSFIGTVVNDRFQIKSALLDSGADKGGIGEIFLASDLRLLGKDVVVKLLRKDSLESEYVSRKFKHEQEALIRLDHPNIVRILDAGTMPNGDPYIVMEHIPGQSLRKMLDAEGTVPLALAADIVESVGAALASAHAQKILHRDIKPENIMLTPTDDGGCRVRLIDFGIARVVDSVTGPHTQVVHTVGTLRYMAPEQLQGVVEQTPAVDVYALGVVTYEMLTGDRPFKPQSTVDMFEQQRTGVKTPPRAHRPEIPEKAEAIVLSAFAFEAGDRPQDARQFAKALADALRSVGSVAHEAPGAMPETMLPQPSVGHSSVNPTEASEPHSPASAAVGEYVASSAGSTSEVGSRRGKNASVALLVAIILMTALALGGFVYYNSQRDAAAGESAAKPAALNQVEYKLVVQKISDGSPEGDPFDSIGEEELSTGDKFDLAIRSEQDGFVYVFAEEGGDAFNILHPTPAQDKGSAAVKAKSAFDTIPSTLSGAPRTERVWLIWTAGRVELLEGARLSAFAGAGTLKDRTLVSELRSFIDKHRAKSSASTDAKAKKITLVGTEDVLVQSVEIKHR